MSQYTSYWLYQKYEKRGDQDWIPVYPNVYSVDGEGSLTAVTKTDNDPACGYVPTGETIYRWVNLNPNFDYYCEECPPDPGTRIYRWTKTTNTICVEDEPVPTGGTKWVATFTGGATASAACDASSAITRGEVSSGVVNIEIGDCVTSIGNRAFWYCSSLSSITLPDSVTSIGNTAFQDCTSLTSITIPSGVTRIGDSAFSSCSSLSSITLPSSVTSINNYAFYGCSSLSSVNIPSGVTSIGEGAFDSCSSLSSITLPNSVTSIGYYAFASCTSLSSITIPDSVTSIDFYVFWGCTGLTSVTIPDSVTSIGERAFYDCSSLSSVTIGNGVTSIDDSAFRYCDGLTSITCLSTIPPTIENLAFDNTNNCPIYVPAASVNDYKSASGWSNYASRIQAIP